MPLPSISNELSANFSLFIGDKGSVPSAQIIPYIQEMITQVTYEQSTEIANLLEITSNNFEFFISDMNVFPEGSIVDLFAGYDNKHEFIGRAELVRWIPKFPRVGTPTITIKGYSLEYAFMKNDGPDSSKGETWSFSNMTATEVITQIVNRNAYSDYGFKTDLKDSKLKRTWKQNKGQSDWNFMKLLASFHGFEVGVESDNKGDTVYFKPCSDNQILSEGDISYNTGFMDVLLSFDAQYGFERIPTAIEVTTVDSKTGVLSSSRVETKKPVEKPKKNTRAKQISYGSSVFLALNGERLIKKQIRSGDPESAAIEAVSLMQKYLNDFFIGTARLMGHPYFKYKQVWNFWGLGSKFDITEGYYFHRVKHILSNSNFYEVEAGVRMVLPPEVIEG